MAVDKRANRVSKIVENTTLDKKNNETKKTVRTKETKPLKSAREILSAVESGELVDEEEETKVEAVEVKTPEPTVEQKSQRVYGQHDLILCRNISASWLKLVGKSGISYVWNGTGDVCEVEYGDLWAKKAARAESLYKPYIIIEDEELLEQPRWKDLKQFYEDKVYGLDNIDQIIAVPANALENVLIEISDGMRKAVAVRAASMVENGLLDSIKKIKIIDRVCNTDLLSVIPE